jgi:hypothetical protein
MEPNGTIQDDRLKSTLARRADGKVEAPELGVERRVGTENQENTEIGPVVENDGASEGHECSSMLMDCSQAEEDAVGLGSIIGVAEENNLMDNSDMCDDSVVFPTLPAQGKNELQVATVEYGDTYKTTPDEGEGEDGTSPGRVNSRDERAFVNSLYGEPVKADGLDSDKDQVLSATPPQDTRPQKTKTLQSSGGVDPQNEDLSSPKAEGGSLEEGRKISGDLLRKDKGPFGDSHLRKVLSDPVR